MHQIKDHGSLHELQENYRLLTQGGLGEPSLQPHSLVGGRPSEHLPEPS